MKHSSVAEKTCLRCNKPVQGRSDKRFCSAYCRSENFNQKKREEQSNGTARHVIKTLLQNRKILSSLLQEKKVIVIEERNLLVKGFNTVFHTHVLKDGRREITGCFEFGYYRMKNKKLKIFIGEIESN